MLGNTFPIYQEIVQIFYYHLLFYDSLELLFLFGWYLGRPLFFGRFHCRTGSKLGDGVEERSLSLSLAAVCLYSTSKLYMEDPSPRSGHSHCLVEAATSTVPSLCSSLQYVTLHLFFLYPLSLFILFFYKKLKKSSASRKSDI